MGLYNLIILMTVYSICILFLQIVVNTVRLLKNEAFTVYPKQYTSDNICLMFVSVPSQTLNQLSDLMHLGYAYFGSNLFLTVFFSFSIFASESYLLYMSSSSPPQPKYRLEKPFTLTKSLLDNALTPPNM